MKRPNKHIETLKKAVTLKKIPAGFSADFPMLQLIPARMIPKITYSSTAQDLPQFYLMCDLHAQFEILSLGKFQKI